MNVDGSRLASRRSPGRIGRSAPSAARRRSDCDHGARPGPLDCPRRRAPRRCCCGVGAARGNAPGGLVGAAHRPTPVGVVDAFGPEQACRFSPRCTSPDVRGSSSRGAVTTTGTSHVNRAERRARWVPQQPAAELSRGIAGFCFGPARPTTRTSRSDAAKGDGPAVSFRTPLHGLWSVCRSSAEDREHLGCLGSYARRDDLDLCSCARRARWRWTSSWRVSPSGECWGWPMRSGAVPPRRARTRLHRPRGQRDRALSQPARPL